MLKTTTNKIIFDPIEGCLEKNAYDRKILTSIGFYSAHSSAHTLNVSSFISRTINTGNERFLIKFIIFTLHTQFYLCFSYKILCLFMVDNSVVRLQSTLFENKLNEKICCVINI